MATTETYIFSEGSESFHQSTLAAVVCPEGTSGTLPGDAGRGGMSSCVPLPGYSGAVIATTDEAKALVASHTDYLKSQGWID